MKRWLTLGSFVLIAAAIVTFRPVQTPGPFLRDFEAYWSAGSASNARADPYGRSIWSAERGVPGVDASHDELLPFVGPPATLPAWRLLARLPYVVAARWWFAALSIAVLSLAAIVVGASAGSVSFSTFFAALALAISFGPVTSDVALGQMALIAFLAATVVALPLSLIPRSAAAFVAFFQPNVAFGLISQLGRNRATLAIAFGLLATYAAGALGTGWHWPIEYALRLLRHEDAERLSAIQLTPGAIAYGAGMPAGTTVLISIAALIAALAAAVLVWRRVADPFARFAAIAALAPFASSFFHEHDLVVAYIAGVWCALRTRAAVRLLALGATLLVAIDWLGLAQRPTGMPQSILLAIATVAAFTALGTDADWRTAALAGGILAATFAVAASLAAMHPAPIWPDALGHFHAVSSASAADVWRDEQRRTGLFAVNPTWAFLRALSLTGCALVSLSVFLQSNRDAHFAHD
ncbi:MAG: hypothetical protein WB615_04875 [Candidatus Tumulicola sp.]